MEKASLTRHSPSIALECSARRHFCSLPVLMLLWLAALRPLTVCAEEPAPPAANPDEKAAAHRTAHLIACPDCLLEVSRRALSCPHCGCPGSAIAEAVAAAERAARPLPVLRAESDRGGGHALVIEENGKLYALLDARLLAGASTLTLSNLRDAKSVSYLRLEAAAEAGLVRLALAPGEQSLASLPLAPSDADATAILTATGETVPYHSSAGAPRLPSAALATLEAGGRVVDLALPVGSATDSERAPFTPRQKWMSVPPADYRAQTALLYRLETASGQTALSPADRAALESTAWLTPYLQKSAAALLHAATQP